MRWLIMLLLAGCAGADEAVSIPPPPAPELPELPIAPPDVRVVGVVDQHPAWNVTFDADGPWTLEGDAMEPGLHHVLLSKRTESFEFGPPDQTHRFRLGEVDGLQIHRSVVPVFDAVVATNTFQNTHQVHFDVTTLPANALVVVRPDGPVGIQEVVLLDGGHNEVGRIEGDAAGVPPLHVIPSLAEPGTWKIRIKVDMVAEADLYVSFWGL